MSFNGEALREKISLYFLHINLSNICLIENFLRFEDYLLRVHIT